MLFLVLIYQRQLLQQSVYKNYHYEQLHAPKHAFICFYLKYYHEFQEFIPSILHI